MRDAVHALKFRGERAVAGPLGRAMAARAAAEGLRADVATWVPLARRSLRKRGHDQARLLAEAAAATLAIPAVRLLVRPHEGPDLGRAGKEAHTVAGRRLGFAPIRTLGGQRVCLVDDVVTSGVTAAACALALETAGAGGVSVLCAGLAGLPSLARACPERTFARLVAGEPHLSVDPEAPYRERPAWK